MQNELEHDFMQQQMHVQWKNERLKGELLKKEEKLMLQQMNAHQNVDLEEVLKGTKYEMAVACKSKGMPYIKKVTNMISILEMVGAAIFALMVVIMA